VEGKEEKEDVKEEDEDFRKFKDFKKQGRSAGALRGSSNNKTH